MNKRTSPTDAIERLSWVLNYVDDGSQSLNSLAEQSDLSWATVQKYIKIIETVQKVAPKIATDSDGVKVGSRSYGMSDLIEDPVAAFTIYLFTQAEMRGGAGEPVDRALCEGLSEKFENSLQQAIELGWVTEVNDEQVKLTPTGMRVAGPARSEVENADQFLNQDELRIHHEGAEEIVTLADTETAAGSSQRELPDEYYSANSYEDDPELNQRNKNVYQAAV